MNSNTSVRFYYLRDRSNFPRFMKNHKSLVKRRIDGNVDKEATLLNIERKLDNWLSTQQNTRGFPIACIAVEINRDENTISYEMSAFAESREGRGKFDRKLAQNIALGRLRSNPLVIKTKVPKSGHEITRIIMNDLVSCAYGFVPTKAKKAAQDWLNSSK